MIYERLILMRDLMHRDGSIYVHCDWRVNSAIRLVLDEVFGATNFRNEICRIKCNPKNYTTSSFGTIHDIVFSTRSLLKQRSTGFVMSAMTSKSRGTSLKLKQRQAGATPQSHFTPRGCALALPVTLGEE